MLVQCRMGLDKDKVGQDVTTGQGRIEGECRFLYHPILSYHPYPVLSHPTPCYTRFFYHAVMYSHNISTFNVYLLYLYCRTTLSVLILYSAKFSRRKIFADSVSIRVSWKQFSRSRFEHCTRKRHYRRNFSRIKTLCMELMWYTHMPYAVMGVQK